MLTTTVFLNPDKEASSEETHMSILIFAMILTNLQASRYLEDHGSDAWVRPFLFTVRGLTKQVILHYN